MLNVNLSVGQPNGYPTTPTTPWTPPAPSSGPVRPSMPPDRYGSGANSGGATPLAAIANDYRRPVDYTALRIAQRLGSLGITTTADLISAANTPTKRNLLAMSLAAFDSQITTANAKQYLQGWLGLADLCRTGMQVDTARLMQASGIFDSASLARYAQPFDKAALYATLTTNAIRFGYRLPAWEEFSRNIDTARTLPYDIRW